MPLAAKLAAKLDANLAANLAALPRAVLAHVPTPLEPLARLRAQLGDLSPRLLIKRDDCTGLALGGNKTRKLEFLMGEALAQGADTVITAGGVQSNHVRQTAAAAAKLGLACELVLTRNVPWSADDYAQTGNIQLDHLLGAAVHIHPAESDRAALMAEIAASLRAQHKHPYIVPIGGSNATGAMGYVNAARELTAQAAAMTLGNIDYLVLASSSGGTQAGLVAGFAALGQNTQVIGIDVDGDGDGVAAIVTEVAGAVLERLGISDDPPGDLPGGAVQVESGYSGAAYGLPTEAMIKAVERTARAEGILLDPVYSGKAMAGLIGLIGQGRFQPDDRIVFLHSGGTPALFAYRSLFA